MNPVVAYINCSALRHNLARLRQIAPESKVLAMIKADAYGHDAIEIAKALDEADALGVSRINEALEIENANVKHNLVLMEGCFNQAELQKASELNFAVVIQNRQQLTDFENVTLPRPINLWLKINTGMNRLGVPYQDTLELFQRLKNHSNCASIAVMTHFASADDTDNDFTEQQLHLFNQVTNTLGVDKSTANSAAILTKPQTHFDWIRPGIALYGNSPIVDKVGSDFGFKPVMTLTSSVIAINTVRTGETVGYGQRWRSNKTTRIAVVAMGYGDGYPRHAKDGTPVMINGQVYPLAGRVSMDMITVDIGLDDQINIGDSVELWGENLPAEHVAQHSDTISYQLFCNLSKRVKKVFV